MSRVRTLLSHPWMPIVAALAGVALTLPSLGVGWHLDDQFHRVLLRDAEGLRGLGRAAMELFRFVDGDPSSTRELMNGGVLPWWTDVEIKIAFWRPLTASTHWLDYRLWPESPALMHAQSVLWYGALVGLVALLQRGVMGATWVAGLAGLLYALDDGHGMPVGWLANRNTVVAAVFGVAACLAHDRWRRYGWRAGCVLGPLLLGLSVLAAEGGVGTFAYLIAHAVVLDRGSWRERATSLLPYMGVIVGWRVAWVALGFGSAHSELYTDPIVEPGAFVVGVVQRLPILTMGLLGVPPADVSVALDGPTVWWLTLGGVVFVIVAVVLLTPLLRRDPATRFWALGMVLALIPICATRPNDRLLMLAGIGGMALVAQFIAFAFDKTKRQSAGQWRRCVLRWCGTGLIVVHVVVAPLLLVVRATWPVGPPAWLEALQVRAPFDESVQTQDVIVVNPPSMLHVGYLGLICDLEGTPVPRRVRALAPGLAGVVMERPDDRTLVVRPTGGYLAGKLDRLLRAKNRPLALGQRIELVGMAAVITALTDDGRPAEIRFEFELPLEDSSHRWLQWTGRDFVPFIPPAVGDRVELIPDKPDSFQRTLM